MLLLGIVLCDMAPSYGTEEIDDAATRAEFGFYSGQRSLVRAAILALEREVAPADEAQRRVLLGYAHWKLAQMLSDDDAGQAAVSASSCIDALDDASVQANAAAGEGRALRAACYRVLATVQGRLKAPLSSLRGGRQIEAAREMAPHDPRVILIDGLLSYERPEAIEGDRNRAYERFTAAVRAFDAEAQGVASAGCWGHAEALAWLGRMSLERGDGLAAREALERALIIAPEYAWAQQLLDATTRPQQVRSQ
jgi:hypothetical protein